MKALGQYTQFYRFGKHGRVGGGNPIRDQEGNITAEYGAFAPSDQPNLN